MSEDIHKWTDGRYTLMFDEHTFFVWDNEKEERMIALEVTKKLNEQQATIEQLQDLCGESDSENAKLRIENEQLQQELRGMNELLKSYRETIKHNAELLADATRNGYLPPLDDFVKR